MSSDRVGGVGVSSLHSFIISSVSRRFGSHLTLLSKASFRPDAGLE